MRQLSNHDFGRVRALFERALDVPLGERRAFVERESHGDGVLSRHVAELLDAHESSGEFLTPPGAERVIELAEAALEAHNGDVIGGYRVERALGSGGMGRVYLAWQERPHRRVALKLLRRVAGSAADLRRFEVEAEILARLEHPAIARLFELGAWNGANASSATPFFAMEYVDGARDAVSFARESGLDLRARVELLAGVCDAVAHAHQRGVIHRDLKPGNVLVDAAGRVKVIDFGVARVFGRELAQSLGTLGGGALGTLAYASPEQLAGDPADVDVRADVYALGALLYELAAGRTPFEVGERPLAEIVRDVCERDPAPPSSRDRSVPREIDWIAARCLAKDRARRYRSAEALAADLRAFLAHGALEAGPDSSLYRARKFVRRHRVAAFVASALVLGVAVAATGLVRGIERAREGERAATLSAQRATREAARSRATVELIQGLFAGIDASVGGRDVRAADLLDSPALAPGAIGDPNVEFEVLTVRAVIYRRLGLFELAHADNERALALVPRLEDGAITPEAIVGARAQLGRDLTRLGRALDGERLMRDAVAEAERANSVRGRIVALRYLFEYLEEKRDTAAMLAVAEELRAASDASGEEWLREEALPYVASAYSAAGRHADAVAIRRAISDASEVRHGELDARTITARIAYVSALRSAKELGVARELLPRVIDGAREVLGPDHELTLQALTHDALAAAESGDVDAGVERAREVVDAYEARGLAPTSNHLVALGVLGVLLTSRGDHETAEPVLRRSAEAAREWLAPDDLNGLATRFNHAACLARLRRWSEAESLLLAAHEHLAQIAPPGHELVRHARETLADVYELNGFAEAAATWRARASE